MHYLGPKEKSILIYQLQDSTDTLDFIGQGFPAHPQPCLAKDRTCTTFLEHFPKFTNPPRDPSPLHAPQWPPAKSSCLPDLVDTKVSIQKWPKVTEIFSRPAGSLGLRVTAPRTSRATSPSSSLPPTTTGAPSGHSPNAMP